MRHRKNLYKNFGICLLWGLIALYTLYSNLVLQIEVLVSHLFYLPIILGVIAWRKRAVWVIGASSCLLGALTLYTFIQSGIFKWENLVRGGFFALIGGVLIWLVEKNRKSEEMSRAIKNQLDDVLEHQVKFLKNTNFDLQQELSGLREEEDKNKGNLAKKEEEVREILHRMKNNFQMIYGLFEISLHTDEIKDQASREILLESKNRIQTMAAIHDILYQESDINDVNLSLYLERLLSLLEKAYRQKNRIITLEHSLETIHVALQQAIPLGLVLNELMTNAYKYAFSEKSSGLIRVKLQKTPDGFLLRFSDNGQGLPAGFDWNKDASFGLQLVNSLTKQLKGEVSWDSIDGLSVNIRVTTV